MRKAKLLANAAVLSCVSLASIACGFWVHRLLDSANQLAVQLPVALASGVAGIVVWLVWFQRVHRLDLERDSLAVILLGLPVSAALVVGGHFLVTGYLTSVGNVVGAWFVFLAEALVSMPIAAAVARGRKLSTGTVPR